MQNRRQFLKKSGLGLAGLASLPLLQCQKSVSQPNLLFIVIEDLCPNLGCYGKSYVKSPNIDKLASKGVRFDRVYAQFPVCAASRASFFTGLRPATTGVEYPYSYYFLEEVRPNHQTFAQYFYEKDYYTRNFGKIHHGKELDEISEPHWKGTASAYVSPEIVKKLESGIPQSQIPPFEEADLPDNQFIDGQTADKVCEVLRGLDGKAPFCFSVGFSRPHLPFSAPKKYWDMYNRDEIPLAENRSRPKGAPDIAYNRYNLAQYKWEHADPKKQFSPDYERLLRQGYFASISFMDAQVGRILDVLDETGQRDNTIIALVADHGFHIGEVNNWGKTTLFEESLHVPLIISAPGYTKGTHTEALVEMVDIMPTLIDLAGYTVPDEIEGTSMKPLFRKPDKPWKKAAFSESTRDEICRKRGFSMRTDQYRYTEWRDTVLDTVLERELYDMKNDPYETVNIANDLENQALVVKLADELRAGWKAALPEGIENLSHNPAAPPPYAWGPEGVTRRQAWHDTYGGSEDMGWRAATEMRLRKEMQIKENAK